MADPIRISYVPSWAERLRSRLYTQFRDKVTWNLLIDEVLAPQFQDLEDSGQSLAGLFDIDNSSGVQLDGIGELVGQPRGGLDDVTYRLFLKARIQANDSAGTPEEIYSLFLALLGASTLMVYRLGGRKAFQIEIRSPVADSLVEPSVGFLRDAKEAGARGIFEWSEFTEALTFSFACGSQASVVVPISESFLMVFATSMFPQDGSEFEVIVDRGLSSEDIVTVVRSSPTQLDITSGQINNQHEIGATVEYLGGAGDGVGPVALFAGAQPIGNTAITCDLSALALGWPASGSIMIDAGISSEETLAYSSITSNQTIHLVATLTKAHKKGATITLLGGYGGNWAGALQA